MSVFLAMPLGLQGLQLASMFVTLVVGLCLGSGVEAQVTDVTGDDGFLLGWSYTKGVIDHCLLHRIHRVEIGEKAERRGAVDPERQEVLQVGMSLRLEGGTWQRQGAQERVDLALGQRT